MKILLLLNTDRNHPVITGGVLRHIYIIEQLARLKPTWEFIVIDNDDLLVSPVYGRLKNLPNVKFSLFQNSSSRIYPMRIIRSIIQTFQMSRKLSVKPDLIYTDYVPALLFPALFLKLFYKIKNVIIVQLLATQNYPFREKFYRWLLLTFADKIIITNPIYKTYLHSPKVLVNTNAISDTFRIAAPTKRDYDLIFVGSIEDNRKGINEYLKVVRRLAKQKLVKKALIVTQSDPTYLNLGNKDNFIEVRHRLNQEEVANCLNRSKVMLFPTHAESYGLVIGEALRCGALVVTSTIPELAFWGDLVIRSNHYYQDTYSLLKDYDHFFQKLMHQTHHPLLSITWEAVAKEEISLLER